MSSWRRPRGHFRLDGIVVSHHALDSFLTRVPGACLATADAQLRELASRAELVRHTVTGAYQYRVDGVGLIVHRPARRAPILLTVTYDGRMA